MCSEYAHFVDINDYPTEKWEEIFSKAHTIKEFLKNFRSNDFSEKVMATLFFENSTRTRLSFQSAMTTMAGDIIDLGEHSSINKGESLKDTIKMVAGYSDIIVIRHKYAGAAKVASMYATCPVINAGDGEHFHPTQTLTDLFTLSEEKHTFSNLTIGVCGDLKLGRTSHSLCRALSLYPNNHFVFIPCDGLEMPDDICDFILKHNCTYEVVKTIEEKIDTFDVLYMTRIQRERIEYNYDLKNFILTKQSLKTAKKDLLILHPLPRNEEISVEVDEDERAFYFKQATNGVYARISLIKMLLDHKEQTELFQGEVMALECNNRNCISRHEKYLPHYFVKTEKGFRCEYCDHINNGLD
ncbi:aspartate carbamoyltransferase [Clostridia bacterium]|nr:aspartate carbamoyltransferase [Clostridia bacterium]